MNTIQPSEIWLVVDSLSFGGIETHVLELANGILQHNRKVRVILVEKYQHDSPLIQKLEHANVPYHYLKNTLLTNTSLKNTRPESLVSLQNVITTLSDLVRLHQPVLLHAHGYKASLLTRSVKLLNPRLRIKQITTYHAGETPQGKVRLYDALDRYSAFASCACLAVSKKIQNKIPTRTSSFNNFIDTSFVTSCLENNRNDKNDNVHLNQASNIAFVGRLSHEKGADRFVKLALNSVHIQSQLDNPTELHFDVYGDGPQLSELTHQSAAVKSKISFHGHQANMAAVWSNIDVLVISSRFEGLPMTALEAMARAIPVICIDVGDLATLIEHKRNGFIASNTANLEKQLIDWLNLSASEQRSIQQNAVDTIRSRYSSQSVIPKMLDFYADVAS